MEAAAFVRRLASKQNLTEGGYLALMEYFGRFISPAGVRIWDIVEGDEDAVAGIVGAALSLSDAALMRRLGVILRGAPCTSAGSAAAALSKLAVLQPLRQKLLQAFFEHIRDRIGGRSALIEEFPKRFPQFARAQFQAGDTADWDVFISEDLEYFRKWSRAADLGELAARLAVFLADALPAAAGERQAPLYQLKNGIYRAAAGDEKNLKTQLSAALKVNAADLLGELANWWTDSREVNLLLLEVHDYIGADGFWANQRVRAIFDEILQQTGRFSGRNAGTRRRLCLLRQCQHDMERSGFGAVDLDLERSVSRFPGLWISGKPVDYDVFYEILQLVYAVGPAKVELAERAVQTEWEWAGVEVALGSEESSEHGKKSPTAGSASRRSSAQDSWDDAPGLGAASRAGEGLTDGAGAGNSDAIDDWE